MKQAITLTVLVLVLLSNIAVLVEGRNRGFNKEPVAVGTTLVKDSVAVETAGAKDTLTFEQELDSVESFLNTHKDKEYNDDEIEPNILSASNHVDAPDYKAVTFYPNGMPKFAVEMHFNKTWRFLPIITYWKATGIAIAMHWPGSSLWYCTKRSENEATFLLSDPRNCPNAR